MERRVKVAAAAARLQNLCSLASLLLFFLLLTTEYNLDFLFRSIWLVRAMRRAHLAVYDSLLYSRTSRAPVAGIECANKATQRHAHSSIYF
uniref:Secreted protein n=1 Tax=Trichogramma kaykai TaxID=54128 RepID=A0ABD2W5F7_9HYME